VRNFRFSKLQSWFRIASLAAVLVFGAGQAAASNCISVTPSNLSLRFGTVAVGTFTLISDVLITNHCTTAININSFSISGSQFELVYGWAPQSENPGKSMDFGLRFVPTAAGTFTGSMTINVQGFSPIVVNLTGTGFVTQAAASLSTSSISFASTAVGSTSAAQSLTITNTGTAAFTADSVYVDPPFTLTGFTEATLLNPGNSITVQVTFQPQLIGTYTQTLVMTSDQLPPKGLTVSGTATSAKSLAISTYPTLPSATQGFSYNAQLNAATGTAPFSWQLASGSTLPSGLVLSLRGVISGTLASSVAVGDYSFTVKVTDASSEHNTATAQLTIPVGAPTGSSCNNITWDITGTTSPEVPITDLGTGTYVGVQGGLYLNGSNTMPASHDTDGVNFANAIQPLDGNGNPDPNGKYALLSIGMSNAFDTFLQLVQDTTAEPTINPHLVFVPGAIPEMAAAQYADPNFGVWTDITNYFLPQSGVTANQVVAAWVMDIDWGMTGTFPADITLLQSEYESIAQNLHSKFPNLTIAFFGSRFYGGYVNGTPHPGSPEPYTYDSGYAVRGMIQDQLNGVPAMNYNPANGPVMAPWVAWADYNWANGLLPRKDRLTWSCQDFTKTGIHNSNPEGREKDANLLLNFFRTDDATAPWFLAH
jgi:hypothetical protein